jgi:hypothetical protein
MTFNSFILFHAFTLQFGSAGRCDSHSKCFWLLLKDTILDFGKDPDDHLEEVGRIAIGI